MEEALEQIAQTTSYQSFLGVLKVPLYIASELTIKRKHNPALVGQNVRVHSGHIILVSILHFVSFFFRNNK